MKNNREFETFERKGVEKDRAYYVPFAIEDSVKEKYGIIDKNYSSEFFLLNGKWQFYANKNIDETEVDEELKNEIKVPCSVQMQGYDYQQYINTRFPIPVNPPSVPKDTPVFHYRRSITVNKDNNKKYYLVFEGVDSFFYLYINKKQVGYSQISHSLSEFDITKYISSGENTVDVIVLKWCASTYLECQDKFRLSGIFRDVYLLTRPNKHITDYKISTTLNGKTGVLTFINESDIDISLQINKDKKTVNKNQTVQIFIENVKTWSAENPNLYTVELSANGEKIIERVGFRKISIEGNVFEFNGKAIKLKGVNRHEFSYKGGAYVTLTETLKDLKLMKDLNVNAIRTSHYPNMPEFYLLCDKLGFYIIDEADVETHGASCMQGGYDWETWMAFAENMMFSESIYMREHSLVERDKNRTCVTLWSLGNESSFGQSFFKGAEYIKSRDDRPVHYEGLQGADKKYYYSKYVDVVSAMYPSIQWIKEKVLDNKEETRPFVLCEYSHAMGNSNGDLKDYWEVIYNNPNCMGGFVWEWADHSIKHGKKWFYGGDHKEKYHDDNFCVDGLLSTDRKLKSGALEMKAVYGGKLESCKKSVSYKKRSFSAQNVSYSVNEKTAEITQLYVNNENVLKTPVSINVLRYIDNDRDLIKYFKDICLREVKPYVYSVLKEGNAYTFDCCLQESGLSPLLNYKIKYELADNELLISIKYKANSYVKNLPRVGLEFAIDKKYGKFKYVGFGPYESYIDKHTACEYGLYTSTAKDNFTPYVMPQETGSHYLCEYMEIDGLLSVTADKDFSFSILPYTTKDIYDKKHNYELKDKGIVNVCLDLAMRGVGSHSCGPCLDEKYEIPKEYENTFKLTF